MSTETKTLTGIARTIAAFKNNNPRSTPPTIELTGLARVQAAFENKNAGKLSPKPSPAAATEPTPLFGVARVQAAFENKRANNSSPSPCLAKDPSGVGVTEECDQPRRVNPLAHYDPERLGRWQPEEVMAELGAILSRKGICTTGEAVQALNERHRRN